MALEQDQAYFVAECSSLIPNEGQRSVSKTVRSRTDPPGLSEGQYLRPSLQQNAGFPSAQTEATATGSTQATSCDSWKEAALLSPQLHHEYCHVAECIACGTVASAADGAGARGKGAEKS